MNFNKELIGKFKQETGKVVDSYGQSYTKDYIKWLEEKQVKLSVMPVVMKQNEQLKCDNHKYVAIYDGYEIGYLECLVCGKVKAF